MNNEYHKANKILNVKLFRYVKNSSRSSSSFLGSAMDATRAMTRMPKRAVRMHMMTIRTCMERATLAMLSAVSWSNRVGTSGRVKSGGKRVGKEMSTQLAVGNTLALVARRAKIAEIEEQPIFSNEFLSNC